MKKTISIDFDEDLYEVTPESIINGINQVPAKEHGAADAERCITMGHIIGLIPNGETLDEVTSILKRKGFLEKLNGIEFPSIGDSVIDHKIKSTVTGLSFMVEHLAMLNDEINDRIGNRLKNRFADRIPPLEISVKGSVLKHNVPELADFVRRKFIASIECLADGFNEPDKRRHLKNLIAALSQLDYQSDRRTFVDDIGYLTTQLNSIVSDRPVLPERFYKTFTPTGYRLFLHIMDNYVQAENEGLAADIAYYYQKMKADDYMHGKQVDFSDWFFEHYNVSISKFRPLEELETPDRKRKYYDALEWLKRA